MEILEMINDVTFNSKFFQKHSKECKVVQLQGGNRLGVMYDSPKGERDFVWDCDTHRIMIVPSGIFKTQIGE